MKRILWGALAAGLIIAGNSLWADTTWKTQTAKDGRTTVKSSLSHRLNQAGKDSLVIEFEVSRTSKLDFGRCVEAIQDLAKHRAIADVKTVTLVKKVTDTEWILHYVFDAPWPLSPSDCVVRMVLTTDVENKSATYTLTAAPDEVPLQKMDRMTVFNVTYGFKDLGQGQVQVTSSAHNSPTFQVPDWMLAGFFPEGPGEILNRIEVQSRG